ncbi:histidine phosphatase family protein [Planomonospora sp. ID82291]|uniref:histidine phosphatase family protein n=1 Tax=Planomonospora sp. ID82291 TaxID=2738136 RepID=UPI0018C3F57B|nr:histidine phosphatase family protein [Planomonospora sp. ID82291]MBG0818664.1 histidine phosphatase family protein [Planomonospora sp. ID82291]
MIVSQLVLIRHGQAHCNVAGVVGGPRTCTGLTGLGRRQVVLTAQRLAAEHSHDPFHALYAGPRRRLQQTGRILAEVVGLPLAVEPGLEGPRHGDADGRPWHEVKSDFGGGPHTRPDLPWATGSDTWNGYLRRAGEFLTQLIGRHEGERVLLAAHGETVLAVHTLLLGIPAGTQSGFTVDHGSITRWQLHRNRFGDDRWMLDRHNDTAHLAGSSEA